MKNRPKLPTSVEDVDPGRAEDAPARRQEVAAQRRHDDDEPLEPHADVDDDRDQRTAPAGSCGTCLNQNSCGTTTLQVTIVQYAQAYGPEARG